ncbi:MAG: hypothetical protein JWM28_4199, partial [Chitinophagaceae bacterium]|nr:hypothetical protein [Chitinophagaceae bacterium]
TLFTSLLMSVAVFATDIKPKSMLTVKSVTPGNIRVIVDGKNFEPVSNTLMIDNVNAGYHSIVVYRKKESGFFRSSGRKFEMVYSASLAVNPATSVLIAIDRFGRADISEQRIAGKGYDRNRHDHDRGYNDRDDIHGQRDDGSWEDNKSYSGYAQAMSDREFDQVMSSMQREWFENNKMKSASYIISGNFFRADQVKEMMSLFSFENNKLKIAKQAYSKTLDKQNYHCVAEALNFSSSREALAYFIRDCE